MRSGLFLSAAVASLQACNAAPTDNTIVERQLLSSVLTQLTGAVTGQQLIGNLTAIKPVSKPTSIAQAVALAGQIAGNPVTNAVDSVASLIANSFVPGDLQNVLTTYSTGINSEVNNNPRNPSGTIYPKKIRSDAPYSLTEAALRQVIYIPSTFTYGRKPPVVLVPGTGSKGGLTFGSNFIKLFQGVDYADPVWLNIPGFLLGDAQVNAEYVAYAINYISGISQNKPVSVIAWSQGNLDTQWALKYWPSTRAITNNLISISPDFHGTVIADLVCPNPLLCTPSLYQQTYSSNFVNTLRTNGGDSAYVPTTTIYSSTDEIVQPQAGTGASAYINDARRKGVTNAQVQLVCAGNVAGGIYTHEGVLYHPLAFALAVDALKNKGGSSLARINTQSVCGNIATPGLSLADVLATEGTIPVAGLAILAYQPKVIVEPPIKSYAYVSTP